MKPKWGLTRQSFSPHALCLLSLCSLFTDKRHEHLKGSSSTGHRHNAQSKQVLRIPDTILGKLHSNLKREKTFVHSMLSCGGRELERGIRRAADRKRHSVHFAKLSLTKVIARLTDFLVAEGRKWLAPKLVSLLSVWLRKFEAFPGSC